MITFTHDKKPLSLGPKAIIDDNLLLNKLEEADTSNNNNKSNNNYENRLLNIDGVLHSLQENPSPTSRHNDYLDEGAFLTLQKIIIVTMET